MGMATQLPNRGHKRSREESAIPQADGPSAIEDLDPTTLDPLQLMHLSSKLKLLPVPEENDDLETTHAKMMDLARVVKEGNSLALYTGLKLAPESPRDAESIAMMQMTPSELMQYKEWKKWQEKNAGGKGDDGGGHLGAGLVSASVSPTSYQPGSSSGGSNSPTTTRATRSSTAATRSTSGISTPTKDSDTISPGPLSFPAFDWVNNVAPVPEGAQSIKKFTQRAAAMDIVWGHEGATPENAAWLTFHMLPALPLVKAVTKATNIKRHLQEKDPQADQLSDMEAKELETVRRIVAVADTNLRRETEKIRRLTREMNKSAAVLRSRILHLEKGEAG